MDDGCFTEPQIFKFVKKSLECSIFRKILLGHLNRLRVFVRPLTYMIDFVSKTMIAPAHKR